MCDYKDVFGYVLIYIMTIPDADHEGLLKVGKTTLNSTLGPTQLLPNCDELNAAAHKRIKEYTKTAMIKYNLLYTELATRIIVMDDGTPMRQVFGDNDIQAVLDRSGYYCKKFPDSNYGSEWYKVDLQTAINAIKAFKEGYNALSSSEKETPSQTSGQDISKKLKLRWEQDLAVERTLTVFKKNDRMLWNCKMRFGKTVSAYELIRRGGFQKTIIVTHRPVVEAGWQSEHDLVFDEDSKHIFVTKEINSATYEYDAAIDSENDRTLRFYNRMGTYFTYFTSMQDLRGSKCVGGKFDKNRAVFDLDWDLIIYDEAHEGTQTDLGQKVMDMLETPKKGKMPKVLSLSGTPYNLLGQYKENVYTWDYVMEQSRKKEFEEDHPAEHNPYADLPEMRILTFNLQKALPNSYRFEAEDMAFNFREFFRTWTGDPEQDFRPIPKGVQKGDFVHEADIESFLDLITKESEDSNYPFSTQKYREMFRHTFWMVPGVKEARALSKLLGQHPVFKNYKVANVAGEGDKEKKYDDALKEVQSAIRENDYTITISCGRLTLGVTVPEWTAVMMLAGSSTTSAAGYMQTIFRVQSAGSIDGKQKEVAYVFDFAPDRALKVLTEVNSLSEKGKRNESDARNALGEFLNFCPVISVDGTQMVKYDVSRMMRQIKKLTVEKAIKSGFEDESIYKDGVGIIMDEEDVELFNKLSNKISGQNKSKHTNKVYINTQGLTAEEYDTTERAKNKPKRERTQEELELLKKRQKLNKEREKVIRLLRAVSIRLPMLIYGASVDIDEEIRMNKFVDIVDDESWLEFMPENLTKDLFKSLLKYYDEDVVIGAGYRIRRMAKAADDLPPTKRVQRIAEIFSYFRNPDKETVLTPWRVVNMHMGDMIGGYNFYEEGYSPDGNLDKPRLISQGNVTHNLISNQHVRFLEMNSKSGLYPLYLTYSIYAMKLPMSEHKMPVEDAKKIWQETVVENIYVLCKTKMAVSITKRTLTGYEDSDVVNAIYLTHLQDRMQKKDRLGHKLMNPKTWGKDGDRLKFNAVVGNPPYQVTGGAGGSSDSPIYQEFAMFAEHLHPDYVSFIIPSRWFSGGRENLLGDFRAYMLQSGKIRKMSVYTNSREIFPTVEIKGGLCYYLLDENYSGDCQYTLIRDGNYTTVERNLNDFDVLIREPVLSDIVKKVMRDNPVTVESIISANTPFGIPTNPKVSKKSPFIVYEDSNADHTTKLYYIDGSQRKVEYISRSAVHKNVEAIDLQKVFIPQGYGAGETYPHQVLGYPEYAGENSVCSQSYVYAGFDSEISAKNFISYLKTKFFRALVLSVKISQDAMSKAYHFVPMQDFSKSWSDEELYKKYNLSDEEISFVEATIKPM